MLINFSLSIVAGIVLAFIYDKIKNHPNANKGDLKK